jgi:nitrate reductase NapE component
MIRDIIQGSIEFVLLSVAVVATYGFIIGVWG